MGQRSGRYDLALLVGVSLQTGLTKRKLGAQAGGLDERTLDKMLSGEAVQPEKGRQLVEFATANLDKATLRACEAPYPPVYNSEKTFDENMLQGPNIRKSMYPGDSELPRSPKSLFDRTIDSPIGLSASVLTCHSRWLLCYAKAGYSVLTYKTVRSKARPAHGLNPNIGYVLGPQSILNDLEPEFFPPRVVAVPYAPHLLSGRRFLTVNCFGSPSDGPEAWTRDVAHCVKTLGPGKLLVLSVIGSIPADAENAVDREDRLVADFVKAVQLGVNIQHHYPPVIEVNVSCPNTFPAERTVYDSAKLASRIAQGARDVITASGKDIRLLLKIGFMPQETLDRFVEETFEYVDGYSAINTRPAEVDLQVGDRLQPFFGQFTTAGVSGIAIRRSALRTIEWMRGRLVKLRADRVIFGMGGVTEAADVDRFVNAGATIVQTTTAAMHDFGFAAKVRQHLHAKPRAAIRPGELSQSQRDQMMLEIVSSHPVFHEFRFGTRGAAAFGGDSPIEVVRREWKRLCEGAGVSTTPLDQGELWRE